MATNMDTVERLPFRPFSLDTRNLLNSVNRNRHMEYLSTLLVSRKLKKCEEWLKEITYSRLVDIEDHFLDAIENDNTDFVEGGRPSLATGDKTKLREVINQIRQRPQKLLEYDDEINECIYQSKYIEVEKFDEILKYLLIISNHPMEPYTTGNVAGYIVKILGNVLSLLQNHSYLRVGYFFTICGVILDLLCGLNYVPFKKEYRRLNQMVNYLRLIASENGRIEYIDGKGNSEEEFKRDREAKFKFIKFIYLPYKGNNQTKAGAFNREEVQNILSEHMSLRAAVVANDTTSAAAAAAVGADSSFDDVSFNFVF